VKDTGILQWSQEARNSHHPISKTIFSLTMRDLLAILSL